MTKTVYFGAGWFNKEQKKAYRQAMEAFKANKTINWDDSYVPLDHQYRNLSVEEHPELLEDKEWAIATYNGDLVGIRTTDISTFVYLPNQEDIGCGVEMGYAKGQGKYVLLIVPDELWGKPINLMSFGIADKVIKLSELRKFNFNHLGFDFYPGQVY